MAGSTYKFVLVGFAVLGATVGAVLAIVRDSSSTLETATGPGSVSSISTGSAGSDSQIAGVTPAQVAAAEAATTRGKEFLYSDRLEDAISAFQQATELAPDPKYFFNLAVTLSAAYRFQEALAVLKKLRAHNPTAQQVEKAESLTSRILSECTEQRVDCFVP